MTCFNKVAVALGAVVVSAPSFAAQNCISNGGKIVSWDEKPSNFDTLTFVRDPSDERRYSVTKKDDGIYVQSGFMLIVR